MKVLFAVSDGIGNIIECLPVVSTLEKSKGWDISFLMCDPSHMIPGSVLQRPTYTMSGIIPEGIESAFEGIIATGKAWDKLYDYHGSHINHVEHLLLNDPDTQRLKDVEKWARSEVDWRLDMARELGIDDADIKYRYHLNTTTAPTYNVVICDGYNHNNTCQCWDVKSYPRWDEVAGGLHDHHRAMGICSVGIEGENVANTVDETGRSLDESLGIIRNAEIVLSNDTGMYHAAALLGTTCVAVFTFTSVVKNHDKRFHRGCHVVKKHLKCQADCYETGHVRHCEKGHECQDIEPQRIINKVMELM